MRIGSAEPTFPDWAAKAQQSVTTPQPLDDSPTVHIDVAPWLSNSLHNVWIHRGQSPSWSRLSVIVKPLLVALLGASALTSTHLSASIAEVKVLSAQRVAAGEDVDVVLINRSAIDTLAKDGKLSASSIADIAGSVAAVAVRNGAPHPDISSPEAFKRLLLSAKSIARPPAAVGGSSGDHIVDVLNRLRIAAEVDAKSVFVLAGASGQEADSAGDAVAKGKAEIALHQLQELMAVPGIEIVGPFPGALQGSFTFAAAIGATAKETKGAQALIDFLRTPRARAVMRAKGMEPTAIGGVMAKVTGFGGGDAANPRTGLIRLD